MILLYFIDNRATVMDPRHKLQYFKNANWEDEWIETAKGIVRDTFDGYVEMSAEKEIEIIDNVSRLVSNTN